MQVNLLWPFQEDTTWGGILVWILLRQQTLQTKTGFHLVLQQSNAPVIEKKKLEPILLVIGQLDIADQKEKDLKAGSYMNGSIHS